MTDVTQAKPDVNVGALDDSELLLLHAELHSYQKEFDQGGDVEGWSKQQLKETHDRVVAEIHSRDLPHQELKGLSTEQSANGQSVSRTEFGLSDDPETRSKQLSGIWSIMKTAKQAGSGPINIGPVKDGTVLVWQASDDDDSGNILLPEIEVIDPPRDDPPRGVTKEVEFVPLDPDEYDQEFDKVLEPFVDLGEWR